MLQANPVDRSHDAEVAGMMAAFWQVNLEQGAAHHRWRDMESPGKDGNLLMGLFDDGKLVGIRGAWSCRLAVPGESMARRVEVDRPVARAVGPENGLIQDQKVTGTNISDRQIYI